MTSPRAPNPPMRARLGGASTLPSHLPTATTLHIPFPGHRNCAEVEVDRFFESLAEHGDVAKAAASGANITAAHGERLLAQAVRKFGGQAR